MNEMYEMSQSIHIFSVIVMIMTLSVILILHKGNAVQETFVKRVAITNLIHVSFLSAVALTGAIMMSAKHLSFSFANIVMIIGLLVIIVLEVKRNKVFKMVIKFQRVELDVYKPMCFKYGLIEMGLLFFISAIAVLVG